MALTNFDILEPPNADTPYNVRFGCCYLCPNGHDEIGGRCYCGEVRYPGEPGEGSGAVNEDKL